MTAAVAGRATEAVSILFVVSAFAVLARTRLEAHIRIYAGQATLLALLGSIGAASVPDAGRAFEIGLAAVLTFAVKAVAVPLLLTRLLERLGGSREVESYVTTPTSILLGGALAACAYALAARVAVGPADGAGGYAPFGALPLAAALTGVFVGLFVMTTRRKAVTQVFGLLLFENGIQFAAFAATGGMAMLFEFGAAFDLLVAVIVLAILILRMRETFGDVDLARLRALRG